MVSFFIYGVLAAISWEDYKFRAVHWWLFVLLLFGLGTLSFLNYGFYVSAERILYNSLFVAVQLFFLTLYFSIKQRQLVNIFEGYFGLGDLCFLVCITVYFPLLNYILFYMLSLLLTILVTVLIRFFMRTKPDSSKIPLAGYQALCLAGWMFFEYCPVATNLSLDFMVWNYY